MQHFFHLFIVFPAIAARCMDCTNKAERVPTQYRQLQKLLPVLSINNIQRYQQKIRRQSCGFFYY